MTDPTQRFTNRVDHYVKYRPSYPPAVLDLLREKCGLTSASVVADVGSGTGILSELFLINGNRVFGIEPNKEMREACERRLGSQPRFTSVAGTAKATTLDDASVDFVTAGRVRPHPQTRGMGGARLELAAQGRDAVPGGV
jgi:SAM-dependent methyltransferase